MRPVFKIVANNTDITNKIKARLISLRITDESGLSSDSLEMQLDDRNNGLTIPATGAELEVSIGYVESGLTLMGLYTVDEVELSAPPATMTIRAKAANMKASLKAQKTRSWHQTTIGDLVSVIAGDHNLIPAVSDALDSVSIDHLDQTEESDLHFLTRLAQQHDAVAKPVNGKLLFVTKGTAKSVSGKAIAPISIHRHHVSGWRLTIAERTKFQAVQAEWQDTDTGQRRSIVAGSGKPVFKLRSTYDDRQAATAAAQAKLMWLNRQGSKGDLTINQGIPTISAETPLVLIDFREGVDGEWIATRVQHSLDNNGLRTTVEFNPPSK